jgi:1,4-alpha-glucan branching enzyme
MKKNKKQEPRLVNVPLSFVLPDASAVCLAGTFNDWNPAAMPLKRNGEHTWTATLRLPPGRYEYRIVADGAWLDVPGAAETVENAFGFRNAVLTVKAA